MGRKKIRIAPITDDRNRSVTYLKRKAGLMKKAHELAILTNSEVAVIVFSQNNKLAEFSSSDIDQLLLRYTNVSVSPCFYLGISLFFYFVGSTETDPFLAASLVFYSFDSMMDPERARVQRILQMTRAIRTTTTRSMTMLRKVVDWEVR